MIEKAVHFRILLVDDDPEEKDVVMRILKALTGSPFTIDHALACSEALALLDKACYDLVLLDNHLSERISARFSVPLIKSRIGNAPIVIISNDVSPTYLQTPDKLGVDQIVEKSAIIDFFRSQLDRLLSYGNPMNHGSRVK